MEAIVVYYSKTGNTKVVADLIADKLGCSSSPINLIEKKGRGTKEERDREKELYSLALHKSKDYELVIIGTPTGFEKPKSMIKRFVRDVNCSVAALFCTYDNKIGTTLSDLENILMERGIEVVQRLCLGGLKPGELVNQKEKPIEIFEKTSFFVKHLHDANI